MVGNGDDEFLVGGLGDDDMTGGIGADIFVFSLGANEGSDEILDFSTAEGDVLSFTDVTDGGDAGTDIGIDDVVATFVDGGGAGFVDTLTLESGTVIMITDVNGTLTDVLSLDANSLINGM